MRFEQNMRMWTLPALLTISIGAACVVSAEGRWTAPSNQWEHQYAASNGLPEVVNSNWQRNSYQSTNPEGVNYVDIVSDENEGDVLMLIHTNGAAVLNRWPNYQMHSAPGSGTTNDLITMDLRFRLADDSQSDATQQLVLNVNRPRLDGAAGRIAWGLNFTKSGLKRNGAVVSGTTLGTGWHTVRWIIDVAANSSKVYLDNVAAPVISGWAGGQDEVPYTHIMFGDGSTDLKGKAAIKFLQWTTNELVEPITFVHEGAVDPLSEGWSYEHDANELFYTASNGVLPEASSPAWNNDKFGDGTTSIVTDEITGEKALHLIMTNTVAPFTHANYYKSNAEGTFDTNRTTICRMRFRLVDETQADSQMQFMCQSCGPRPDGVVPGRQSFYVAFSKDRIRYFDNSSSMSQYMVALSTNWHEIIWVINWRTQEASFYLDGAPTAIFTHQSNQDAYALNHTGFGDGSANITGIARVSSYRLTRQCVEWDAGSEDGTEYWEGIDSGLSQGDYSGIIPADVIGHADGWTASARVWAVDASSPLHAVSMIVQDGTDRWSMMFTPTQSYYYNQASEAVSLGGYVHHAGYHTVQMYYDPSGDGGNGTVRYYDDGWLKGTITRADTLLDVVDSPRIQWGSISIIDTSVQRWNWVELAPGNRVIDRIPQKGTLIMVK